MSLSTKTYSAGDVIASSQPFAHALDNKYKKLYCDSCLTTNQTLIPCTNCLLMHYCDQICQSNDWNCHKLECKAFVENREAINDCYLLKDSYIILRLILMINNRPNIKSKKYSLHNGLQRCFDDLMSHEIEIENDCNEGINELFKLLYVLRINIRYEELCRLVGQYNTNSFGLYGNSDTDYTEIERNVIGAGIYISLSVFDHSCQPNAAFINDGISLQIRAMKRIEPNDEITISYIDVEMPKSDRQSMLKSDYYFDCDCVKCENDMDEDFDYKQLNNLLYKHEQTKLSQTSYVNYINSKKFREKLGTIIKLLKQILNLKLSLYRNNSPECSNVMYVRSLLLMIAMDCNVSGYMMDNIKPFIKSTQDYLKITHGIEHNVYKKFIETVNSNMSTYRRKIYTPGDVIIASEPFVHILGIHNKERYCDYCFKSCKCENIIGLKPLKRCAKCRFMFYCDRNCQANDWIIHKFECVLFAKYMHYIYDKSILCHSLIVLRLFLLLKNDPNFATKKFNLYDGRKLCFNELEIRANHHITSGAISFYTYFSRAFNLDITLDQVMRLYGQCSSNAVAIYDYEKPSITCTQRCYQIGYGIYIPLSVFKHSCLPNAANINNGINMQIRAMKHIKLNEEISISYIDIEKPKSDRQLELKTIYYYDCHCVKCEKNLDENFDYKKYYELIDGSYIPYYKNLNNFSKFLSNEEEVFKLQKQLYYNSYSVTYSRRMLIHSMKLFIENRDCRKYPTKKIKQFLQTTERNLKITFGTEHQLYKRFIGDCGQRFKF